MSKLTPEILLCLKDSNVKTRDAAYQILMSLASRRGNPETLKTFAAALGAETAHMRSAAVMAFSRLVYENAWEDEYLQGQLPSLLRTILVLMSENSREVVKSVVSFVRICVSALPPKTLEPLLPELVGSLLTHDKAKDRFRAKIKIILQKLVKRFGYEALMPHVPASETTLITHMRKLEQRLRRKKETSKREKSEFPAFDQMLSSDEEDSGDDRTLTLRASGVSRNTGQTTTAKSVKSRSDWQSTIASAMPRCSATVRLPNEADGDVVDMLGAKVRQQVRFAEDMAGDEDSDDEAVEFDDDGKLVVRDDTKIETHDAAADALTPGPRKRMRLHTAQTSLQGQESVASSKIKANSKRTRELGAAYKSNKAGGDVKKKHHIYEPYTYVPLDGRSYSKKNRRSAVEKMSSVVRQGGKRNRKRKIEVEASRVGRQVSTYENTKAGSSLLASPL